METPLSVNLNEFQANQVLKDPLDHLASLDWMELLDLLDLQEKTGQMDNRVQTGNPGRKDQLARQESPEREVFVQNTVPWTAEYSSRMEHADKNQSVGNTNGLYLCMFDTLPRLLQYHHVLVSTEKKFADSIIFALRFIYSAEFFFLQMLLIRISSSENSTE